MQIRWSVVGEALVLGWESLTSRMAPREILSAVVVFSCVMAYLMCSRATRRQLMTVCTMQSILLLVWVVCVVVLHLSGVS